MATLIDIDQPSTSKPVHIQRIEKATKLRSLFSSYIPQTLLSSSSDEEEDIVVDDVPEDSESDGTEGYQQYAVLEDSDRERSWLNGILQEDSDEEYSNLEQVKMLVKDRTYHRAVAVDKEAAIRNMYYGVGLVSNVDKFPEHKRTCMKAFNTESSSKDDVRKTELYGTLSDALDAVSDEPCMDFGIQNDIQPFDDDSIMNSDIMSGMSHQTGLSHSPKKKLKKFKDEETKKKWEDLMTIKRKKVFTSIVKKEVGKQHRAKINKHKEMLLQCKRVALQCQKVVRQKALVRIMIHEARTRPIGNSNSSLDFFVKIDSNTYLHIGPDHYVRQFLNEEIKQSPETSES